MNAVRPMTRDELDAVVRWLQRRITREAAASMLRTGYTPPLGADPGETFAMFVHGGKQYLVTVDVARRCIGEHDTWRVVAAPGGLEHILNAHGWGFVGGGGA